MSALRLAAVELARFTTGPLVRRLVPLALVLLPTLYGGLYLWSNWDPYGRLKNVPVAVVNLDEPVTAMGRTVDAGNKFVEELTQDHTLGWRFVSEDEARRGLEDGTYYFIVTVPRNFSADLASPLSLEPRRAHLTFTLNDARGFTIGKMGESVEPELQRRVNSAAFAAYTQGVLGKLPELHDQMAKAADGAAKLSTGTGTAVGGAQKLADGITQLSDGSKTLADGAGQVADGTQQLVDAVDEAVATFEGEVAHVASAVREGAGTAAATVEVLTRLADKAVADTSAVLTTVKQLCAADPGPVCRDAVRAATTAHRITVKVSKDLHELQRLLTKAANVPPTLDALAKLLVTGEHTVLTVADDLTRATTKAARAAAAVHRHVKHRCAGDPGPVCTGLVELTKEVKLAAEWVNTAQHRIDAAVRRLAGIVDQAAARLTELPGTIAEAQSQVQLLNDGAHKVADGANQLRDNLGKAEDGANELTSGLVKLKTGANELASGLDAGVKKIPSIRPALRAKMADVLSNPVEIRTDVENPAHVNGRGLAPFFFGIALWVLGLLGYQILRPFNARALAGDLPSTTVALGGWLPIMGIGALAVGVLYSAVDLGLGLDPLQPVHTVGIMLLGAAAFTAISYALRAALGVVGGLLSLVLLMLQLTSGGGTYPVLTSPQPFKFLHPVLPMSYLIDGLRVSISGGREQDFWYDVLVLTGYLAGALALAALVAHKQRTWTFGRMKPAVEM
ncbi:YhgE/Pip domain-containing protein [Streptomyces sp. TBY4]|uniref:YhgE/Pip domain-containing protein n=1 Tax=Streptomyces sp. TBY4 TaxID=2962030 RepID=UPI0020B76998|nr:YhgE/Pip domain-containing protein [Streptomyces sp. TBY4]MCP3757998.1 YhgE/Pip domain-containing protein [Streptomyces sp. TBY4]